MSYIHRSVIFLALTVCLAPAIVFAEESQESIKITAIGPTESVRVGNDLKIGVDVENISGRVIHASYAGDEDHGEEDFRVRIVNESGKSPSHTKYGKQVFNDNDAQCCRISAAQPPLTLYPGDIFRRSIDLSEIFTIDQPGIYFITVSTVPPGEIGFAVEDDLDIITSNSIEVKIVP